MSKPKSRKKAALRVLEGNLDGLPTPEQIILAGDFPGAFREDKINIEAARLVGFFQQGRGGWQRFSLDHLREYYQGEGYSTQGMLFGLLGPWVDQCLFRKTRIRTPDVYIVMFPNGHMAVTDRFVKKIRKFAR